MKKVICPFLVGLAILSVGCPVRSIFPLFLKQENIFDPTLVGKWLIVGKEFPHTATITGTADGYGIKFPVSNENSKTQYHEYEARLGQLGAYRFLDTYQIIHEDAQDHLIQAHQFHRLWLGGDTLRLATLDVNWLSTMIDSNKISLPHIRREKEIILTASTKELQAFIVLYADDPNAFTKTGMYVRVR